MKNARDLLKSENINSIAIAAVSKDGFTFSLYERGDNGATLIGSIERLKKRVLDDDVIE